MCQRGKFGLVVAHFKILNLPMVSKYVIKNTHTISPYYHATQKIHSRHPEDQEYQSG